MKLFAQLSQRWPLYLLTALILLLFVYAVFGERGAIHLWRLRGEKITLDEKNFRLQKENDALRKRISRLRTDDLYLEQVAREELNLVRPGEIIYRFPSTQPRKSRTAALSAPAPESPPSAAQKAPR
ncbi:MAG: septum formation initiator family protein [Deltaproteobacteria bacterium]|nr:septum formation initiator family protein [Deltaproteobacteria bacterium]MDZ4345318.1 septum formation initiator family protein [Candidatus Binatia bacterium]